MAAVTRGLWWMIVLALLGAGCSGGGGEDARHTGIAGSDSIEPREGELLLEPRDEPDTGRLGFIGGERSGSNPFGVIDFGDAEESDES